MKSYVDKKSDHNEEGCLCLSFIILMLYKNALGNNFKSKQLTQ